MFELIDHTADVAVRFTSANEAELLRDATRALLAVFLDETSDAVDPSERIAIRLEAEDGESLFVDFLNELVFLFDTRRFLARDLALDELRLDAPARVVGALAGETLDPHRHRAKTEIKAATFHDLAIRRAETGLTAEVIFDL